jgi:hypothetical protein
MLAVLLSVPALITAGMHQPPLHLSRYTIPCCTVPCCTPLYPVVPLAIFTISPLLCTDVHARGDEDGPSGRRPQRARRCVVGARTAHDRRSFHPRGICPYSSERLYINHSALYESCTASRPMIENAENKQILIFMRSLTLTLMIIAVRQNLLLLVLLLLRVL